jgi:5,6,7,8-tetrahydromethanopterin hydro-lyase
VLIGEGFAGDGVNAAHINVVLGERNGPVGTAWATALATPRPGHVPFVAVARPGMPLHPFTLFVNKATIENDSHGSFTWGAAQAGVSAGVGDAFAQGSLDRSSSHTFDMVLIVAVWVNPGADDEEAVFANNRVATAAALAMATSSDPAPIDDLLSAMADPSNPYFRT